jgi:hypothetical protein
MAKSRETGSPEEADLLPGSVSRLNAFVPERIAQIEHLYQELLAQAEARHKSQVEELTADLRDKSINLAESEAREDELRKRLRLQLKAAERLCRFLDGRMTPAAWLPPRRAGKYKSDCCLEGKIFRSGRENC